MSNIIQLFPKKQTNQDFSVGVPIFSPSVSQKENQDWLYKLRQLSKDHLESLPDEEAGEAFEIWHRIWFGY